MPWMSCKDCEHCLYKNCSANEYPCILCCRGIEKYDMWKSARRMKGADDERMYTAQSFDIVPISAKVLDLSDE